jgi:hypothetical protein
MPHLPLQFSRQRAKLSSGEVASQHSLKAPQKLKSPRWKGRAHDERLTHLTSEIEET